jgi:hypothetical protein
MLSCEVSRVAFSDNGDYLSGSQRPTATSRATRLLSGNYLVGIVDGGLEEGARLSDGLELPKDSEHLRARTPSRIPALEEMI